MRTGSICLTAPRYTHPHQLSSLAVSRQAPSGDHFTPRRKLELGVRAGVAAAAHEAAAAAAVSGGRGSGGAAAAACNLALLTLVLSLYGVEPTGGCVEPQLEH